MVDERQRARATVALAIARTNATRRAQFQYSVLWAAGCILGALAIGGAMDPWQLYILSVILISIGAWHNGRLSV